VKGEKRNIFVAVLVLDQQNQVDRFLPENLAH
jgi:hypothetical protein